MNDTINTGSNNFGNTLLCPIESLWLDDLHFGCQYKAHKITGILFTEYFQDKGIRSRIHNIQRWEVSFPHPSQFWIAFLLVTYWPITTVKTRHMTFSWSLHYCIPSKFWYIPECRAWSSLSSHITALYHMTLTQCHMTWSDQSLAWKVW